MRERVRQMEEGRNLEVKGLEEKIERLFQYAEGLERKMESNEAEWREEIRNLGVGSRVS